MDPITVAIVGAFANLGESVIKDAYNALKAAIAHKCGINSDLIKAVEDLEKKPNSAGRKETLKEEVATAKADQDPEILKAAQALLDLLKTQSSSEQHIQSAEGSYIAQADRGSTATVTVKRKERKNV